MSKYERFKIILLAIFVAGFLYCCYNYSENGKYIISNNEIPQIINSRTGGR